jgi:hypothetical protein
MVAAGVWIKVFGVPGADERVLLLWFRIYGSG